MKEISLKQLLPLDQRKERQETKRYKLLSFLRQEIFTNAEVAGIVMDLQSRQAVHKSLTAFERDGLIRRDAIVLLDGTKATLWGITSHGLGWAFDPASGELPGSRVFEPSRVSGAVLRHTLDVQIVRLGAERSGWSNWQAGDRLAKWQKNTKRPDALARDPYGRLTAIEVERSFKSVKRYHVILSEYLQLIKQGTIDRVVWASPDSAFTERLKTIITSIKEVPVAGQKIRIDPERHHVNLFFCDYANWPLL